MKGKNMPGKMYHRFWSEANCDSARFALIERNGANNVNKAKAILPDAFQ